MTPIVGVLWLAIFAACTIGARSSFFFSFLAASTIASIISVPLFSRDFFQPPVFLCTYTLLGALDVIFVATGVRSVSTQHLEGVYTKSLLLIAIWLAAFLIAYNFCGRSRCSHQMRGVVSHKGSDNAQYAYGFIIAIVLLTVSFAVFKALSASMRLGGIVQGMLYGGATFEDQGYLMQLLALAGMAPVALLHVGKSRAAVVVALLIFLGIALTGRRSLTLIAVVVPFLVYYNYRIKRVTGVQIVFASIAAVAFVLFVGSIRTASEPGYSQASSILEMFSKLTSYVGYGRNLPDLIASMDSGRIPFQGGTYLFRGLQYFIPRSIWVDKPLVHSSDIVSNILYFEGDVGRPVGPYGWSYFCFGYGGVVLAGILSGYFAKRVYLWMLNDKGVFRLMFFSSTIFSILEVVTPESQMKIIFCAVVIWIFVFLTRRKTEIFNEDKGVAADLILSGTGQISAIDVKGQRGSVPSKTRGGVL